MSYGYTTPVSYSQDCDMNSQHAHDQGSSDYTQQTEHNIDRGNTAQVTLRSDTCSDPDTYSMGHGTHMSYGYTEPASYSQGYDLEQVSATAYPPHPYPTQCDDTYYEQVCTDYNNYSANNNCSQLPLTVNGTEVPDSTHNYGKKDNAAYQSETDWNYDANAYSSMPNTHQHYLSDSDSQQYTYNNTYYTDQYNQTQSYQSHYQYPGNTGNMMNVYDDNHEHVTEDQSSDTTTYGYGPDMLQVNTVNYDMHNVRYQEHVPWHGNNSYTSGINVDACNAAMQEGTNCHVDETAESPESSFVPNSPYERNSSEMSQLENQITGWYDGQQQQNYNRVLESVQTLTSDSYCESNGHGPVRCTTELRCTQTFYYN